MGTGRRSRSAAKTRHREKHKALGLCLDCSNKAKDGRVRCEKCLKRRNEWYKEYFIKKKKLEDLM